MNHPKLWISAGAAGVAAVALSVVMAWLVDNGGYYGYAGYQVLLTFERTLWWFQLFGAVLLIIGCIGMSVILPGRIALLIGFSGIPVALVVTLLFGGTGILNVHSWTIALLLPLLLVFLNSVLLGAVGSVRLIRERH